MTYNPFERGRHPVGVKTMEWTDTSRNRTLPVEVWYPATENYRDQDLNPATQDKFTPVWLAALDDNAELATQTAVRDAQKEDGATPLVLLIHGWAGFRQEATFIGTHLASHGFTVVSPDIISSTYPDVDAFFNSQEPLGKPAAMDAHLEGIAKFRQGDVPFLIDAAEQYLDVDTAKVGITGASFGGWTSLMAPGVDARIAASVPMCPAGGRAPAQPKNHSPLIDMLSMKWHKPVPTLMLTASRDSLLPLDGQFDLLRRIPAANKKMVILADSDHNHFVDDIDAGQAWLKDYVERVARLFPDGPGEWPIAASLVVPQEELCPGDHAHTAWRGLTLAHMDAHIRSNNDAAAFLEGPIDLILGEQGIATNTIAGCPVIERSRNGQREIVAAQ
jgi:dienelactone hydrolase